MFSMTLFRDTNPDLIIGFLCALGTILSMGFLVGSPAAPLKNSFPLTPVIPPQILLINTSRRSGFVLLGLLAVTAATVYVASSTNIGFPYRAKTNVQGCPTW